MENTKFVIDTYLKEHGYDTMISFDTSFLELKLDSITFIGLIVHLESEFDIEFEDEMLLISSYNTIGDMVNYVESKL